MTPTQLEQAYVAMLRIRRVEERIADHYAQQQMRCPVHLCIGQEATAVGTCAALGSEDLVLSGHRSHGHYLARGGDLPALWAELHGKSNGCCRGRGGSMHLVDLQAGFLASTPIVAGSIPVAVGAAWGTRLQDKPGISVAFFGEGATEEGVFFESLNFAALHHLPVLFVCENNLYSVYTPLEARQPAQRDLCAIVAAHGIDAVRGDGNDVEMVHELSTRAVQRIRQGAGPCFVELSTYRWREHCGPNFDNDLGYRDPGEAAQWSEQCPLRRAQRRLSEIDRWTPKQQQAWETAIDTELDQAIAATEASPFAEAESMNLYEYAP
jgi:pyruvate dehydrogenase E1 component alpha subunit